jgi:hypothetical protein
VRTGLRLRLTRADYPIRGGALRALTAAAMLISTATTSNASQETAAPDSAVVLKAVQEAVVAYLATENPFALDPAPRRSWVLAQLESAAAKLPGDDWITGQRVGFLFQHRDTVGSLAVARDCRASTWWCAALTGFALHHLGWPVRADSAFDIALREMPAQERCRWSDLSVLLDLEAASVYASQDCARRINLERRIWWLADPLYLEPGNDRRTEHFARRVGLLLHEQLLELDRRVCVEPHWHSVVRGGWSTLTFSFSNSYTPRIRNVAGFAFFPAAGAVLDPLHAESSDWHVEWMVGQERYLPSYGWFQQLDQQVAAFYRGDSLLVVAASAIEDSVLIAHGPRRAGVVFARNEDDTPIVQIDDVDRERYVFKVSLPRDRYLLSIETLGRGAFGRVRLGVGPPPPRTGRIGISDLLLFEFESDVPQGLDSVAERMLGTTRLPSHRTVGVYWEMYDLLAGEIVTVALSVVPDRGRGLLRRVGEAVRILSPPAPPVRG